MHSNYRHQQHLLSPTASQPSIHTSIPSPACKTSHRSKQEQEQQQASAMTSSNFNGLPSSAMNNVEIQQSQISPGNYSVPFSKRHQQQHSNKLLNSIRQEASKFEQAAPSITLQSAFSSARYLQAASSDKQLADQRKFRGSNSNLQHHSIARSAEQQVTAQMPTDPHFYSQTDTLHHSFELSNRQIQQNSPASRQQTYSNNNNIHQHCNSNNNQHLQILQQHKLSSKLQENPSHQHQFKSSDYVDESALLNDAHAHQEERYASQLRGSHLQQRFHLSSTGQQNQYLHSNSSSNLQSHNYNHMQQKQKQQVVDQSQPTQSSILSTATTSSCQQQSELAKSRQQQLVKSLVPASGKIETRQQVHVNFNRSNGSGTDADEGDSRKKKYLTAKYGQQQMNLIKKRLKIEMWLYEQLQELAKGSKSETELDDIDIDLDQLLDIDNDEKRRHWLEKILEPFSDLQPSRLKEFIDEVLEQSKLL